MPYLLKSEPDKYSYTDLQRDGETVWDGIRNPQALITLRNMRKGEHCVIYHSNIGKEAVGTATVVKVDPTDPKNPVVTLKAGKLLRQPKPLAAMREEALFHDSLLFRQFRLSVVPLTDEQYDWLVNGKVKATTSVQAKKSATAPDKTAAKAASSRKGKKA